MRLVQLLLKNSSVMQD